MRAPRRRRLDSRTAARTRNPLSRAMQALEGARVLDPAVAAGDAFSSALVAGPVRRAALQGAWLGHALHPLVIEMPMGTWMSATALDLLGGDDARGSATLLTGLGVASAVPAALTGWAEYAASGRPERRVGVVHAAANGIGVTLQTASLAARVTGRHRLGVLLGLGAMGVTGGAGFLGGHLAAARKVGTHDPSFGARHGAPTPQDRLAS